jgi:Fe-S-cluster containining protein
MNFRHLLKKPKPEDCTTCGLCCSVSEEADSIADIAECEEKRLLYFLRVYGVPDGLGWRIRAARIRQPKESPIAGAYLSTCVAYKGVPGVSGLCIIHNAKPEICQKFKVGGSVCLKVRETFVKCVRSGRHDIAVL